MTSNERHKNRYLRRKEKRNKKKLEKLKELGTFSEVFSFQNLYDSFKYCKQGVMWKSSIQSYQANLPINTYDIYLKLNQDEWKSKGFVEFDIMERGKLRHIQSVHISERCIQRCFCDNYLVPALERTLIYDNSASIKTKGTDFALKRIKKHLYDYYQKHGTNVGYILLYDFSNYFGNINHEQLFKQNEYNFIDIRLWILYRQLINAFDDGLGLGSQVSQISAVAFPNKIDHYFKDQLGVKGYARYMDDGYIISDNLETLNFCIDRLFELCTELGITINQKKIKICRIDKGFVWLKKKIKLTDTGKVIMKLSRKSITAQRRKLKRLPKQPKVTFDDIQISYKSWRGNAKRYNNYYTIRRMDKLFNYLFITPFIKGVSI